jgi:hypothetical protein
MQSFPHWLLAILLLVGLLSTQPSHQANLQPPLVEVSQDGLGEFYALYRLRW